MTNKYLEKIAARLSTLNREGEIVPGDYEIAKTIPRSAIYGAGGYEAGGFLGHLAKGSKGAKYGKLIGMSVGINAGLNHSIYRQTNSKKDKW